MHIANVSFETGWQRASFRLRILGTLLLAGLLIRLKAEILKSRAELENEFVD
jgi:hypothetical protein